MSFLFGVSVVLLCGAVIQTLFTYVLTKAFKVERATWTRAGMSAFLSIPIYGFSVIVLTSGEGMALAFIYMAVIFLMQFFILGICYRPKKAQIIALIALHISSVYTLCLWFYVFLIAWT